MRLEMLWTRSIQETYLVEISIMVKDIYSRIKSEAERVFDF